MFGVYFLVELFRQKRKQKQLTGEEWVPLVDEQGSIVGQAPRSEVHNGSKLLHPVVHLLVSFSAKMHKVYKWETEVEAELVYLFTTFDFKNAKIQSNEVDEIRYWTKNQIGNQIGQGVFTPNFEYEFGLLKEMVII